MKQAFVNKIKHNHVLGLVTVCGRYTYKLDEQGRVIRCKTSDLHREWIDDAGRVITAWEVVA